MTKGIVATKWQNMNNPVRSAGLDTIVQQNPERVQYLIVEPFQGSVPVFCVSSGTAGGYSNSSPKDLTE
jgi:hypothetical protein